MTFSELSGALDKAVSNIQQKQKAADDANEKAKTANAELETAKIEANSLRAEFQKQMDTVFGSSGGRVRQ